MLKSLEQFKQSMSLFFKGLKKQIAPQALIFLHVQTMLLKLLSFVSVKDSRSNKLLIAPYPY